MAVTSGAIIAGVALVASVVSAREQQRAAKRAADAQEEAGEISGAQQQIEQRRSRRQSIREERIRRARILQSAENTGVGASSSSFGAVGALGTQTGANIANTRSAARAAQGITRQGQIAADAQRRGAEAAAFGQVSSSIFSAVGGFGNFSGGNIFASQNPSGVEVVDLRS